MSRPGRSRRCWRLGRDPLEERRADRAAALQATRPRTTSGDLADDYIASRAAGWRNPKSPAQWRASLQIHAAAIQAIEAVISNRMSFTGSRK